MSYFVAESTCRLYGWAGTILGCMLLKSTSLAFGPHFVWFGGVTLSGVGMTGTSSSTSAFNFVVSSEVIAVQICCSLLKCSMELRVVTGHCYIVTDCCFMLLAFVHHLDVSDSIFSSFFLFCCPFLHFIVV